MKRKLDELGSPSQTNPLEVLTEVSERVARTKGVEIQRIRVQGEKITLEVGLDDFSASDLLMRKLRQSRKFCSIQEKTSGVAGNAKISVEMSLCKE